MANYPNPPGVNPRDKRTGERRTLGARLGPQRLVKIAEAYGVTAA